MSSLIPVFLKGAAMGAADIVPGVSGGTIALITGIYGRLIDSLRAFDLNLLRLLFDQGMRACWRRIDGNFLLTLFLGIAFSLFSLARLVSWAMDEHLVLVYSGFSGLILASCYVLLGELSGYSRGKLLAFILGMIFMILVSEIRPTEVVVNPLTLFFSGAIAICAMILPGISGSFLLLVMGMYQPVLEAVHNLDLARLLIFIAGCASGLLGFIRVLSWALHHHRELLMAFLSGVLLASLKLLWPWKSATGMNVLPHQLSDIGLAFGCALLGLLMVFVISSYHHRLELQQHTLP